MRGRQALIVACLLTLGLVALAEPRTLFARAAARSPASSEAHIPGAYVGGGERAAPPLVAARRAADECTRYAAPGGHDGSRGTKAQPFKTAQRLAGSLRAGQTGCLRAGVYDQDRGGYVLQVARGGTPRAPLTIRGYPGERVTLVGIIEVRKRAAGVTLSHVNIEGTGRTNTVKIYADYVVVEDSDITNLGRGESCMILGSNSGYGEAARVIVRRNRFHDCGSAANDNHDHGIYVQNVVDAQIVGNVFWNSAAYAVHLYPNARRTEVSGNVIDGGEPSTRGGVLFGGDDDYASRDNVVERNVIAYARTSNITSTYDDEKGTGNLARNNCLWGAKEHNIDTSDGGFEARGNIVARPLFVNRGKHDYRLQKRSRCVRVLG